MNQNYKNSYKVTEKELVSLSVYNVGFQKCDPLYQWGPGIRDHYLIHYVISGKGIAVTDGTEEPLSAGVCHICKKGSAHSITNTGTEDLVLLTVVAER